VIVDSSALVAVLLREPGHEAVLERLEAEPPAAVGASTLAEAGIVLAARMGVSGHTLLARFVHEAEFSVIPFSEEHWDVAVDAFLRYGKGRHPARLNYGDCLTYAVARIADEPLLCIGDDFPKTDLTLALPV
jgi:ribonuclease VapC